MNPALLINVRRQIDQIKAECSDHDDMQLLADMLEGATDLDYVVSRLVLEIRAAEAQAKGLGEQSAKLNERAKSHDMRGDKLRGILKGLILEAGVTKVGNASIGYPKPALIIKNEGEIPKEFFRDKPALDKPAVKAALENGQTVPGAELSNPEPYVRIN